jgi:glycosyltransferase involved in cell wall biosynthesis
MPPLVSVCIPTYNYGGVVGRAIQSVLAQTERDLELIVIDDQSTDGTADVVRPHLADARVAFVENERNLGLFANFNRCLELARGEYVKVLCADDWLHPRSLEDALSVLAAEPRTAMATSPGWLVDWEGRLTGLLRGPFGLTRRVGGRRAMESLADWGNVAPGMPSHVLLRCSAVEEVGGFEEAFAPASDVHLWLKLLARYDLGWVPEPRCYLRIHARHDYEWGTDPDESVFALWEDMAGREPRSVDAALLERARYGEARRCLLYVGAHAIALRPERARSVWAAAARHVSWRRLAPRLARDLPGIALGQLRRLAAIATGRLVIYGPAPARGPRLRGVPAATFARCSPAC